jgi:hypothetical protein
MSVDTKAIIRKGTTIEQIEKALSEKYTVIEVIARVPDFMHVIFNDGSEKRTLSVSFDQQISSEGISGVRLSLGHRESSIQILRYLCETFGGYLDENDCDDNDYYPINYHLFSQGTEFTKLDEFRHKVISELGFPNLKKVMALLEDYSKLANPPAESFDADDWLLEKKGISNHPNISGYEFQASQLMAEFANDYFLNPLNKNK